MGKIFMVVAAALLILFGSARTSAQECPASLKHYWNLEENDNGFEDLVGGLNAQVEKETSQVLGIVNSGQYFNGVSEMSVPDNPSFDWSKDASFSIEFWINKSSVCPENRSLYNNVVIGRDDASTKLHWWAGVSCLNNGKIDFTLKSNDGLGNTVIGVKNIIDGRWHHVVITRNGATKKSAIFVDGALEAENEFAYQDNFASGEPVNIGWLNLDAKYHLDASIDELAVYDSDLDESVILAHYNEGSGCDYCTGLVTELPDVPNESAKFYVYPTVIRSDFNVSFSLDTDQQVQISIYDITGRKIADLLNKNVKRGTHDYSFDASNIKHAPVILRMQLNREVYTKKLLIE